MPRCEPYTLFALWIVRCNRPMGITERDQELRDAVWSITSGAYTLPMRTEIILQIELLKEEGDELVRRMVKKLDTEGIKVTVSTDLWSENGHALLGSTGYAIVERPALPDDKGCGSSTPLSDPCRFEFLEMLLAASPFSGLSHTGDAIITEVKKKLASFGIGIFVMEGDTIIKDTVAQAVHAAPTDNAANMIKGFGDFEGATCASHSLQIEVGP